MNKPVTAVALLLLAVMVVGALAIVLGSMLPSNEKAPEDIARAMALADDGVKKDISDKGSYSIISIKAANDVYRPQFGEPGFKNVNGDVYNVHLKLSDGWDADNAVYSVNITSGKIIGRFFYDAMMSPYNAVVTLQPGECWYVMATTSFYGPSKAFVGIECEPKDAEIFPIMLGADDMERFVKGQPYEALTFFDSRMNMTWTYNGTTPAGNGWSREVSLTGNGTSNPGCVYFALMNGDNRTVHIDYAPNIY